MTGEILFTNAAIQNQDFSLDEKPYKATGILVAQLLNHLYTTDDAVHCWNTVGMFNDVAQTSPEERLRQKYESTFMQEHLSKWNTADKTTVARDDDANFSIWSQHVIERALSSGNIYIEKADFIHCNNCDITLAESVVPVHTCSKCGSQNNLTVEQEVGLFANTPDDYKTLLPYERQFNKINLKHEIRSLEQIPHRLLLSRDRNNGISLESVGLPNKRIDPRLGIGMLALYVAKTREFESVGIVQSASTLTRITPYLGSIFPNPADLDLPRYTYIFHSKIEPSLFNDHSIPYELLALQAIAQRGDVTPNSMPLLAREHATLKRLLPLAAEHADMVANVKPDVITARLQSGNFTSIVAEVNRELGRAINSTKHGQIPGTEQQNHINAAVASGKLLDI